MYIYIYIYIYRQQNTSITSIASTEDFVEGKSRQIDSSFVTDNRKARRNVQKQKEAEIDRQSYAEAVRNITENSVDFSLCKFGQR